jgi:hypothetical protein
LRQFCDLGWELRIDEAFSEMSNWMRMMKYIRLALRNWKMKEVRGLERKVQRFSERLLKKAV